MKKQPQKTKSQPKISADLPVQALTDLESSQLSGGVTWAKTASSNPKTDAGSTWSG